MSENIELSYVWDHTISKILLHDLNSKMGNMIKEWVVFNKLEDVNSLLKYTDDDFTPTGNLCYINQNGEKLHRKLMKEFFNLRWYIQHLVDENEYQYDDNEWTNPLSESNWTYQTNKTFMKYVNFTLKEMNPEQLSRTLSQFIPIKNLIQRKGSQTQINKNPPYQTKRKRNILHFHLFQNKILNQTLMLMILNIQKIHIHLKQCKFIIHITQQCMIKMI